MTPTFDLEYLSKNSHEFRKAVNRNRRTNSSIINKCLNFVGVDRCVINIPFETYISRSRVQKITINKYLENNTNESHDIYPMDKQNLCFAESTRSNP